MEQLNIRILRGSHENFSPVRGMRRWPAAWRVSKPDCLCRMTLTVPPISTPTHVQATSAAARAVIKSLLLVDVGRRQRAAEILHTAWLSNEKVTPVVATFQECEPTAAHMQ